MAWGISLSLIICYEQYTHTLSQSSNPDPSFIHLKKCEVLIRGGQKNQKIELNKKTEPLLTVLKLN